MELYQIVLRQENYRWWYQKQTFRILMKGEKLVPERMITTQN
jgi:hypothetical protein